MLQAVAIIKNSCIIFDNIGENVAFLPLLRKRVNLYRFTEVVLYTRKIEGCPQALVLHGKSVFGTFSGHPQRLDIRGIERPYATSVPLPTVISNLRIKSRLSFFFSIGDYTGCIDFFDAKIFGFAEASFWNTVTKQRFVYRSLMGPRRRFVPHRLDTAMTTSYSKRRYIRIGWDRKHDKLSVIFNLHGNSVRPGANAALLAKFSSPEFGELTSVLPSPTFRRCAANYYASMPLHGAVTIAPRHQPKKTMADTEGSAFLDINRTYMKFRSHGEFLTGLGVIDGKQIAFRISAGSQEAVEKDSFNGNVLFYGGKVTPLPPAVITHPYGITNKWIIQDTENMIDLEFTPVSDSPNVISVLVLRSEYHTIYGTFEGTLMTADGQKISFRSLKGLSKKYLIRL